MSIDPNELKQGQLVKIDSPVIDLDTATVLSLPDAAGIMRVGKRTGGGEFKTEIVHYDDIAQIMEVSA